VSITDGGYLEMHNTAERLGKLIGSMGRKIYKLPNGKAVPPVHDSPVRSSNTRRVLTNEPENG
jgi:hypothetical protein